jgi:hypothetical protein
MAYQTGRNYQVNKKVESVFNTLPGATGASAFRPSGGGGMQVNKGVFASQEIRRDGLTLLGRHGMRTATGSLNGELSLATFDDWFEALMRDTWAAVLTGTQADFTTITTTTTTIVAASGSFITKGFRVGDVVQLTNHSTAGNNSRNLTITALTASVMTVAETLITDAAPDATFTITRTKKLTRLSGTSYLDRTFTIEEYGIDTDLSEVYTGCVVNSVRLQLQPTGMIMATWGLVGADATALATGTSPYFTNPTITTSLPMIAADATLYQDGVALVDLTGFDITMAINAQGAQIIGSYVTPAMFTNALAITGSFSALRKDLARLTGFLAETEYSIGIKMVENETEPKDFFNIFLPSVKYSDVNKNELGANGPRIETVPLLIGLDSTRPAQYDATSIAIQTSAA